VLTGIEINTGKLIVRFIQYSKEEIMDLVKLFSPIKIGEIELKNRIVMAPMGTNFENIDGSISESLIEYFEVRAKEGVGLIISPHTLVDRQQGKGGIGVFSDGFIPGLNKLCEQVQSYGAKIFLQLGHHGGKIGREIIEKKPIAPSSIHSPIYPEVPKELTIDEIIELIKDFAEAARRAKDAGFDGVEVHGGHTYLIGQFLSPHTNRRKDEYGKDFDGRMKFPSQIIKEIKNVCGKYFTIGFKFSSYEYLENGIDINLAKKIAQCMEKEGVHYLHVSATSSTVPGFQDCDYPSVPSIYSSQGSLVKLAETIKKSVNIPVIAIGGITDPEYAEKILQEGKADLVAIGRALIADPEWATKANKNKKIKYCIKCNTCHKRLFSKKVLKCTVNPFVGNERRFEMRKSLIPKKVVIVGAGPAGMEAALIASQRGHSTTLYEEEKFVGGKMKYAAVPKFKQEVSKLLEYYEEALTRSPVKIVLGQKIDFERLCLENADVVVVSVGADPIIPKIQGITKYNATTVIDLFKDGLADIKKEVVIVGAGLIGCETSWYLASKGKTVKVLDVISNDEILADEHDTNRSMLLRSMKKEGVQIIDKSEVISIEEKGLVINRKPNCKKEFIYADNVIFACGFKPRIELKNQLSNGSFNATVYYIGDCVKPRKLYEAIHEGASVAWEI
jgi:2,4-dienoyl-CoA reductase-like NADH-dependent reductase (Old Yellow Enzyme family)/thioredoxin reductase